VTADAPEGWEEVFSGPCVEAEVIQAVLESNALRVITQGLGQETVFSGLQFEECQVFVPSFDAQRARQVLAERPQEDPGGQDEARP
jgi:hypothetical protein